MLLVATFAHKAAGYRFAYSDQSLICCADFLRTWCMLQDLSMLCMSQNPDERPPFAQIVTRLEELSDLAATDPLEMMSEGYPMHIL